MPPPVTADTVSSTTFKVTRTKASFWHPFWLWAASHTTRVTVTAIAYATAITAVQQRPRRPSSAASYCSAVTAALTTVIAVTVTVALSRLAAAVVCLHLRAAAAAASCVLLSATTAAALLQHAALQHSP
jgi:hypothetical protein